MLAVVLSVNVSTSECDAVERTVLLRDSLSDAVRTRDRVSVKGCDRVNASVADRLLDDVADGSSDSDSVRDVVGVWTSDAEGESDIVAERTTRFLVLDSVRSAVSVLVASENFRMAFPR